MDLKKLDDIQIHFIIGPGRSGTTLLSLILNQHPNCISTPEIKHFLYFYKKYKNIKVISEELLNDLKKYFIEVGGQKKNLIFDIEVDFFLLKHLKIKQEITYSQLTKFLYLSFFQTREEIDNITCIIDKNPFYTFHTEKILNIFPEAKFITTLRDYRAFVLSHKQSPNVLRSVRNIAYLAYSWKFYANELIKIKNKYPKKLLLIHYEDLAQNKETEIQKIFQHINQPYTNNVFNFYKPLIEKAEKLKASPSVKERIVKIITALSQPINTDRIYAWRQALTDSEKKNIELICSKEGKYFSYEREQKINLFDKVFFFIQNTPSRVRVNIIYLLKSVKLNHYFSEAKKHNLLTKRNSK